MPSWIARLVELQPVGPGSGSFRTSKAFGAGPRLFGGLIAAQALAAAGATVDPGRLPQSLHAYFIRGGRVGVDVDYDVETTRDGRSFATRRVTASQEAVPIFEMLASFHRPEETLDWHRPARPRLPLAEATTVVNAPEGWMDHFETRVAAGLRPQWPTQPFWFRSTKPIEDDPLLRACALTFVSDIGMVSVARPPRRHEPGPGGAARRMRADRALGPRRHALGADRGLRVPVVGGTHQIASEPWNEIGEFADLVLPGNEGLLEFAAPPLWEWPGKGATRRARSSTTPRSCNSAGRWEAVHR